MRRWIARIMVRVCNRALKDAALALAAYRERRLWTSIGYSLRHWALYFLASAVLRAIRG